MPSNNQKLLKISLKEPQFLSEGSDC